MITVREWSMDKEVTCIEDTVLYLLKKVGQKFPSIVFKNTRECEQFCVRKVHYFKSDVVFTYVHFNQQGEVMSVPKSFLKKEIFERHADDKGSLDTGTVRFLLLNESWDNHARFLPVEETDVEQHTQKVKLGTLVKALCKEVDSDTVSLFCDAVADEIKLMFANRYEVSVSDKPSDIYTMKSSFKSCMVDCRAERFELYDIVPTIKIAYISNGGILRARALLHESTYYKKPIRIMDRIYYTDSTYLAAMKKWAINNGYWYKTKQSLNWNEFTNGQGAIKKFSSMKMKAGDVVHKFIEVPYVDTFHKLITDEDGNMCLGMERARGKHIADIRYASSRHIPQILMDNTAKHCRNCNELNRDSSIVTLTGFDRFTGKERKIEVCKTCAEDAMLCPRCGEYHIWKNEYASIKGMANHMNTYSGDKYEEWGGRVCTKCMLELFEEEKTKRAA